MHCRKSSSIKAADVYVTSKTDAAVGNLMGWLIAMTLTKGHSNCNAEFKSICIIHSVILCDVLVFPGDLSPYRVWEIKLVKGVWYSKCFTFS